MKSLPQISGQPGRLRGEQSLVGLRPKHPGIDFQFQAAASKTKSGVSSHKLTRPTFAPGFRDLSNEFLGTEAKRDYVAEALFFAIIVGVSAWPVVSMLRALAELTR